MLKKRGPLPPELTPAAVAGLLAELAAPDRGSIFDPFCATSGVLSNLIPRLADRELTLVGRNWGAQKTGPEGEDPAPGREAARGQFDCVLTNFPFQTKGGKSACDSGHFLAALDSLKPNGRCACIVSNGFLGRDGPMDRRARKALMTENDLEAVILLPEDTYQNAKVFSAILSLRHQPPGAAPITVVDLRGQKLDQETVEWVASICLGRAAVRKGGAVRTLDRGAVKPPSYLLHPDHYAGQAGAGRKRGWRQDPVERSLRELDRLFLDRFPDPVGRSEGGPYGDKRPGRELFSLKGGAKRPKGERDWAGNYPVYNGAGICGYTGAPNMREPLPTLIINRAGSYCGRVHYTDKPCFVEENAMFLSEYWKGYDPLFLFFLFRAADLNRWKIGTAVPYIRQEAVYDTAFLVPPPEAQREFVHAVSDRVREIMEIWEERAAMLRQEAIF